MRASRDAASIYADWVENGRGESGSAPKSRGKPWTFCEYTNEHHTIVGCSVTYDFVHATYLDGPVVDWIADSVVELAWLNQYHVAGFCYRSLAQRKKFHPEFYTREFSSPETFAIAERHARLYATQLLIEQCGGIPTGVPQSLVTDLAIACRGGKPISDDVLGYTSGGLNSVHNFGRPSCDHFSISSPYDKPLHGPRSHYADTAPRCSQCGNCGHYPLSLECPVYSEEVAAEEGEGGEEDGGDDDDDNYDDDDDDYGEEVEGSQVGDDVNGEVEKGGEAESEGVPR